MDFAGPNSTRILPRLDATLKSRVGNPGTTVLDIYLFLNIFPSHFGLPILITTLLLARARRNLTLVNMCITFMITGIVSSILLYSGKQTGPEPPPLLCLTQASLLYAVPPMVSMAALALVFQLWSTVVWKPGQKVRGPALFLLLLPPYIVFFGFSLAGAMIGVRIPANVSRNRRFFYCSVRAPMFSNIVAITSAIILFITTIMEVWIGVTLFRNQRTTRPMAERQRRQNREQDRSPKRLGAEDLQLAIRIGVFGLYIVVGFVISLLSIKAPTSVVPDMIMASIGMAVFLVFGSQPSLWKVWASVFRRDRSSAIVPFPISTQQTQQTQQTETMESIESFADMEKRGGPPELAISTDSRTLPQKPKN